MSEQTSKQSLRKFKGSQTLVNGWLSALNLHEPPLLWNPNRTRNPIPFTNRPASFESDPSSDDWSSMSPRESSIFESATRRHSSLTDWSATAGEVERRQKEMASLPGSESGPRWLGADRSFEKTEMTANFWREGCGALVFSSRGVYDSMDAQPRGSKGTGKCGRRRVKESIIVSYFMFSCLREITPNFCS